MVKAPLKYHLINPLKIRTDEPDLDFFAARSMAEEKVKSLCPNPPVLVSWYNATTGEYYPQAECSCAGKPGWLAHDDYQPGFGVE